MKKTTEELNEMVTKEYEGVQKPTEQPIYDNYEYESYIQELLDEKGIEYDYDQLRRLATSYYDELVDLGYNDEDYIMDNEAKEKAFKKATKEVLKINIDEYESSMKL